MADQFCLRWNNFQSNIVSALDSLKCSEDLVDVTLTCDGRNIKAHKVILSACSPYFRNVFKENPCQHPVIILKDVPADDIVNLLSYMYQGEVFIEESKLSSFLHTACLLQVKGLTGVTQKENFTSPNPVNKLYSQLTISPKSQLLGNKEIRTYGAKKRRSSASDKPSDILFADNYKKTKPLDNADIKNKSVPQNKLDNIVFLPENNNEKNDTKIEHHGLANGKNSISQNHNLNESVTIKTEVMDEAESLAAVMTNSENDDSLPDYENSMLARSLLQGINPSKTDNSSNTSAKKLSSMTEINITKALPMEGESSNLPAVVKSPHKNEENIVKLERKSPKPDSEYEPEILLSEHQDGSSDIYGQEQSQGLMLLAGMSSVSLQPGASTSQGVAHQSNHAAICGDCPHCGMKYSNQSALKYHVRLMHSDLTNRLCCYLCPRSFTMRETFKEHMWTSHGQRN